MTVVPSPASLDPVSRKAKTEFVRLLAAELKSSLSAGFDPAVISARIDESGREAEAQDKDSISPPPHFAVFGSSHMQRTISQLRQTGYRVRDLTQKSWVLGKKSCDTLAGAILADSIPADTTVVLDLFGNSSTKFRQEDDTLALAVKNGGGGGLAYVGRDRLHPR